MLSEAITAATTAFVDPNKSVKKLHGFINEVVFPFFQKSARLCHGRRTGRWVERFLLLWMMYQLISLASNPFLPWVCFFRSISKLPFI